MYTSNEFVLHGGDTAFANRQKVLFDKLSVAEKEHRDKNTTARGSDPDASMEIEKTSTLEPPPKVGHKRKNETRGYRGKESIFKRPEGPAPRACMRNVPDYHKNPHKWVKYSLGDVPNEDMTERGNTQAALSFLKELKTRRLQRAEDGEHKMDIEDVELDGRQNESKITFKSKKIKTNSQIEFRKRDTPMAESSSVIVDSNDKPVFRSSKIIMPEYIVGQKQKKKKKEKPIIKIDRSKQLKLDHLQEPDEEED